MCAFFIYLEGSVNGDIFCAGKRIDVPILDAVQLVRVLPSTVFGLEPVYYRCVLCDFPSSMRA